MADHDQAEEDIKGYPGAECWLIPIYGLEDVHERVTSRPDADDGVPKICF